jgi:hypothetical protein
LATSKNPAIANLFSLSLDACLVAQPAHRAIEPGIVGTAQAALALLGSRLALQAHPGANATAYLVANAGLGLRADNHDYLPWPQRNGVHRSDPPKVLILVASCSAFRSCFLFENPTGHTLSTVGHKSNMIVTKLQPTILRKLASLWRLMTCSEQKNPYRSVMSEKQSESGSRQRKAVTPAAMHSYAEVLRAIADRHDDLAMAMQRHGLPHIDAGNLKTALEGIHRLSRFLGACTSAFVENVAGGGMYEFEGAVAKLQAITNRLANQADKGVSAPVFPALPAAAPTEKAAALFELETQAKRVHNGVQGKPTKTPPRKKAKP